MGVGDFKKSSWGRCSRTDKGVHAVINAVTCRINIKMDFLPPSVRSEEKGLSKLDHKKLIEWDRIVELLNNTLPDDIRIYAFKLVNDKFNAKSAASSRLYEYLIPFKLFFTEKDAQPINEEEKTKKLEKINEICKKFYGTHRFHNYTKMDHNISKSLNRHILGFSASFLDTKGLLPGETTESSQADNLYIKFDIHGQSFLYNQIRKMIGCVVQIFQENLTLEFIDNSFRPNMFEIWLAPAEGLLLASVIFYCKEFFGVLWWDGPFDGVSFVLKEQIMFDRYNQRKNTKEKLGITTEEVKLENWLIIIGGKVRANGQVQKGSLLLHSGAKQKAKGL